MKPFRKYVTGPVEPNMHTYTLTHICSFLLTVVRSSRLLVTVRLPVTNMEMHPSAENNTLDSAEYRHMFYLHTNTNHIFHSDQDGIHTEHSETEWPSIQRIQTLNKDVAYSEYLPCGFIVSSKCRAEETTRLEVGKGPLNCSAWNVRRAHAKLVGREGCVVCVII